MSGSCDGVPHPANDRAKTANSTARNRRICTSQLANEPMIIRSIYFRSIQVGGKVLRGLAGPEAGVGGNVLVKPLIWGRNQTRGTPYAGKAFSRARGRARRMQISLFRVQRFQLGGKKWGMRRRWATVPKIFLEGWIFHLSRSNKQ